MTDIRSQARRKRSASLWCGWIALGGAGLPVLLWAMIMVGNEGPTLLALIAAVLGIVVGTGFL